MTKRIEKSLIISRSTVTKFRIVCLKRKWRHHSLPSVFLTTRHIFEMETVVLRIIAASHNSVWKRHIRASEWSSTNHFTRFLNRRPWTIDKCLYGTNLFVVEAGGEREHTGARIQRKNVVGPVRNQGIAQLTIGAIRVCVRRNDLTYSTSSRHVLRNVEGIRGVLECWRVVVCIGHL